MDIVVTLKNNYLTKRYDEPDPISSQGTYRLEFIVWFTRLTGGKS